MAQWECRECGFANLYLRKKCRNCGTKRHVDLTALKPNSTYLHLKSNKPYILIGCAIDATNSRDGLEVIIYKNKEGMIFVRDKKEFLEKFVPSKDIPGTELLEPTTILHNGTKSELLRLLKVAKSDCKQHNWEKLLLVLDSIREKLSSV